MRPLPNRKKGRFGPRAEQGKQRRGIEKRSGRKRDEVGDEVQKRGVLNEREEREKEERVGDGERDRGRWWS